MRTGKLTHDKKPKLLRSPQGPYGLASVTSPVSPHFTSSSLTGLKTHHSPSPNSSVPQEPSHMPFPLPVLLLASFSHGSSFSWARIQARNRIHTKWSMWGDFTGGSWVGELKVRLLGTNNTRKPLSHLGLKEQEEEMVLPEPRVS